MVGDDYVRALKGAACVINVLNQQGRGANNLRTFEATGLGCFLLTEWSPEHAGDLFVEGEELVCFSDAAELRSKLLHYLQRPEEREAIARRGQARTLRDHTLTKRLEAVLAVAAEVAAAAASGAGYPVRDTAPR